METGQMVKTVGSLGDNRTTTETKTENEQQRRKERDDFDQLVQQLLAQEHEKGKTNCEDKHKERKCEGEEKGEIKSKITGISDNK